MDVVRLVGNMEYGWYENRLVLGGFVEGMDQQYVAGPVSTHRASKGWL